LWRDLCPESSRAFQSSGSGGACDGHLSASSETPALLLHPIRAVPVEVMERNHLPTGMRATSAFNFDDKWRSKLNWFALFYVNTTPLSSLARSLCCTLPGPLRTIACQQICARVPPSTRLLCVRWLVAYAVRCRVLCARSLVSRSVRVCLRIATLLSRAPSGSAAQRRCPPFLRPTEGLV